MSFQGLLLLPFAIIYGLISWVRNKLFDFGIIQEKKHSIPTISMGNLSMGGTGKTPHIEYLIRMLQDQYKLATLSRGYGRKTKGFILADEDSTFLTIGDEAMQYFDKFTKVTIAVDENRNHGVEELMKLFPDLDLILLDDAFQHRYIKPGLNILLSDFYHLYSDDYLLPSGRLREARCGSHRADIVIVTKTPSILSPITRRRISDELKLRKHQILLFSKISYGKLCPFSTLNTDALKEHYTHIVLFTGISNNYPMVDYLKQFCSDMSVLSFQDHRQFTDNDIELILGTYNDVYTKNKILVTTEKDVMRLQAYKKIYLFDDLPLYYLPICTTFHNGDADIFSKKINKYINGFGKKSKAIK